MTATTSNDFMFLRKEIDRLHGSDGEKLVKAVDRIENSYRRLQDAILDASTNHLTREDLEELAELAKDREENARAEADAEVASSGRRRSLAKLEARRLLKRLVIDMRVKHGAHETLNLLEANLDEIAEQITKEKG